VIAEYELNFFGQHIAGRIGRGAANLQVEFDATLLGNVRNDGIPVPSREVDVVLIDRREVVARLLCLGRSRQESQ